jgi:hypothetical protein
MMKKRFLITCAREALMVMGYQPAAAVRLAARIFGAVVDALRGEATPEIVAAVREIVQALKEQHATTYAALTAVDIEHADGQKIGEEAARARELGELAGHLQAALPPEDPRPEPVADPGLYRPAPPGVRTWGPAGEKTFDQVVDEALKDAEESPDAD